MTDNHTNDIRDLFARAMSDAPDPHPWTEVAQRSRRHDAALAPPRRRPGLWLAATACVVALVGALVAVVASDDEPPAPIDDPDSTTPSTATAPSTTTPTPTPTTTLPTTEAGWTGGLLDDIDVDALRPLDLFTGGDVVIPTAPSGWRVDDSGWRDGDPESVWHVDVTEARPDNQFGQVLYLRMTREPTCEASRACLPWGESATINGVEWQMLVVEGIPEDTEDFFANMFLRTSVGDRWVWVSAGAFQLVDGTLLEDPPIIEFLEGLRVGSPDVVTAVGEACWQCGDAGAEGDPFAATESSTANSTTPSDDGEIATSVPSDVGSEIGRPLTDLVEGDVLFPTYIPPGLTLQIPAQRFIHGDGTLQTWFNLETPDGIYANSAGLHDFGRPLGPPTASELDDPNHPPVDIGGLTWVWNDFGEARHAVSGSFAVSVSLHGLDRSEAERFIEGLRAVPAEQFPGTIVDSD